MSTPSTARTAGYSRGYAAGRAKAAREFKLNHYQITEQNRELEDARRQLANLKARLREAERFVPVPGCHYGFPGGAISTDTPSDIRDPEWLRLLQRYLHLLEKGAIHAQKWREEFTI